MRRVRGCEVLAAPLALALLVATGLGFGGVVASQAPADEPRPARADFVGELTRVQAVPPAGGAQPPTGKFVAVVPAAGDVADGPVVPTRARAVAGGPAACAPSARSVRGPPPLAGA